jgi:hypothetical protein
MSIHRDAPFRRACPPKTVTWVVPRGRPRGRRDSGSTALIELLEQRLVSQVNVAVGVQVEDRAIAAQSAVEASPASVHQNLVGRVHPTVVIAIAKRKTQTVDAVRVIRELHSHRQHATTTTPIAIMDEARCGIRPMRRCR